MNLHIVLSVTLCLISMFICDVAAACGQSSLSTKCKPSTAKKSTMERPTSTEIVEILQAHNSLRNKIATGGESLPTAADMLELVWDDGLANTAQEWANMCTLGHDDSSCRKTGTSFSYVGQNAAYNEMSAGFPVSKYSWTTTVNNWYSEINDYVGQPDKFTGSDAAAGKMVGHFTQVIWSRTGSVGCGKASYVVDRSGGDYYYRYYVCNYGPGGNFLNSPVYKKGAAASTCPGGSAKSPKYAGLCRQQ